MATSRRTDSNSTEASSSLEDAMREQMPGWKLVSSSTGADAFAAAGDSQETQQGVDVATLRKKFLGGRAATEAADAVRGRDAATRGAAQVEVFRIEPAGGGPTQVAERRNGKIRIVTG